MPGFAAVGGFEEPATWSVILICVLPGSEAQLPKPGVDHIRICLVDLHVRTADVFTIRKNLLPVLAAVGGKINPALLVWTVGMAERGGENAIRIAWIDG